MSLQPTYGRFHVLAGPNDRGPLVHIRLLEGPILQVLTGGAAYAGTLSGVSVVGAAAAPMPMLLGVLIAVPTATASVRAGGELELRCRDRSAVELVMVVPLDPAPVAPLMDELFLSLIAAVGAMEAVLADYDGADAPLLTRPTPPDAGSVAAMFSPLLLRGAPIDKNSAFRNAAAAGVQQLGARASVASETAGRVRKAILDARRRKAEMDVRRRVREREQLKLAKRVTWDTGDGIPVPRKKTQVQQVDLFEDSESEAENELGTSGKSTATGDGRTNTGVPEAPLRIDASRDIDTTFGERLPQRVNGGSAGTGDIVEPAARSVSVPELDDAGQGAILTATSTALPSSNPVGHLHTAGPPHPPAKKKRKKLKAIV